MDKIYHFSAPGRTEIGGNHTDHQHGCVIAAAVDMETTAEVRLNGTNVIRCIDSRRGGGVCPAWLQARGL